MRKQDFLKALQAEYPFVKNVHGTHRDEVRAAYIVVDTDIPKPQDTIKLYSTTNTPWTKKSLDLLLEALPNIYEERKNAYEIWYKPKE